MPVIHVNFNKDEEMWIYDMLKERMRMHRALGETSSMAKTVKHILELKLRKDWIKYRESKNTDIGKRIADDLEKEEQNPEGQSDDKLAEGTPESQGTCELRSGLPDTPSSEGQLDNQRPEKESGVEDDARDHGHGGGRNLPMSEAGVFDDGRNPPDTEGG